MIVDRAIALLDAARYKLTDEECEAVNVAIGELNQRSLAITRHQARINRLTGRIKRCEELLQLDPANMYDGYPVAKRMYLDKITLTRWLETLAQRQRRLINGE